jgi:hypothetical protein
MDARVEPAQDEEYPQRRWRSAATADLPRLPSAEAPEPRPGDVLIAVRAASLNPVNGCGAHCLTEWGKNQSRPAGQDSDAARSGGVNHLGLSFFPRFRRKIPCPVRRVWASGEFSVQSL